MNASIFAKVREKKNASVYLIEAQGLFAPMLADVLAEAGLKVRGASRGADAHLLLEAQPDIVFIDTDFVVHEPVGVVAMVHALLPNASIFVYTSDSRWTTSQSFPGAGAVFSKNADRQKMVADIRELTFRP